MPGPFCISCKLGIYMQYFTGLNNYQGVRTESYQRYVDSMAVTLRVN